MAALGENTRASAYSSRTFIGLVLPRRLCAHSHRAAAMSTCGRPSLRGHFMSRFPPPLSVWADEPYDSQSSRPPLHCFPAGSHLPTWRLFSEYCSQEGVLKGKKKLCCWASQERALYIYFNEETGDVNKAPSFIAAQSKCLTSHFRHP